MHALRRAARLGVLIVVAVLLAALAGIVRLPPGARSAGPAGRSSAPAARSTPPVVTPGTAYNSDDWFRLQRGYPNGRLPPESVLEDAMEGLGPPDGRQPVSPGPARRPRLDLPGDRWVAIGPRPIYAQSSSYTGRVTAVAPHPTIAQTIYIGTDGGGIWRTTDGGGTWTSLTNAVPVAAIQSLAIDPVDPLILHATTIQRTYGTRWLRSTNGGATWTVSPIINEEGETLSQRLCSVNDFKACIPPSSGRIIVDPRFAGSGSTSTVYYAGLSHLLRSDDSGRTFRALLSLDVDLDFGDPEAPNDSPEAEYIRDVALDPTRPDRLFVAVVQPSCANPSCTRTSGAVAVYRSLDGGASWTRTPLATLAEFAPGAGTRYADPGAIYVPRLRVAVAPSRPNTVAVAIRDEVQNRVRLLKSVDGGQNWSALPGPANSVTWPLAVVFSPTDGDTVYVGSAANYRSTDGGRTWTMLDATHTDNVVMAFDAGGTLLVGNDGGIWRATGGTGMEPIHAGLPITELYSIAAHPTNPLLLAGGAQDNGNVVFQGSLGWSVYTGGDGGDTVWDPTPGATTVYAEIEWLFFNGSQVFTFFRCQQGGCQQRTNGLDLADDGPFIPRIIMDPTNPATLYLTVEHLWRTDNGAANWSRASPSVANLQRCWQDAQDGSKCAAAAYFTAAAVAATAPQTLYGGTLNGDVRVSTDRGASWRSIAGTEAGPLPVRPVTDVAVDPFDAGSLYVSYSGFVSGGSGSGHVFHTPDGGTTWTDITGNLPDVPVNTLLIDPDSTSPGTPRVLFAGTDLGVYRARLTAGAPSWTRFGSGLPRVVVNRLAYSPAARMLLAATYGRGVYAISNRFSR